MIFEIFQHMCIAVIGMLESERDTQIDFTNPNGVKFESIVARTFMDEFYLGLQITYEDDEMDHCYIEDFLRLKDTEEITAQHVIEAAITMADFVDQNRNIDQYDLIELKNRHHDNY